MILLEGGFQIPISSKCNLHCKNCGFIDYNTTGESTAEKNMDVNDVIYLDKKITDMNLCLDEIELFGGEPTINPHFKEIVEYLESRRGIFYQKINITTNGLNFTNDVVESCKKLDRIDISAYPIKNYSSLKDFTNTLESSNVMKTLRKFVSEVHIHWREEFDYSVPNQSLPEDVDIDYIFSMCYQQKMCRVMTFDGIYRCNAIHHEKIDIYPYDKNVLIENFINNKDKPIDYCKECDVAMAIYLDSIGKSHLYKKNWKSNNKKIDEKVFSRGTNLIKQYENT
tara:strand:+ start:2081 stop:2926 length:846 start_codon:yes stop_codon:yes gene_type:complete